MNSFFWRSKKAFLSGAVSLAAGVSLATDRYVDDDNYDANCVTYQDYVAKGLDGSAKEKAFGTIQAAIDAASTNDVVKICPGVYTNGTSDTVTWSHSTCKNLKQKARVYVTKKLTLESTDRWGQTPDMWGQTPENLAFSFSL